MTGDLVYLACADTCEIEVRRLGGDGTLATQSVAAVPGIDGPSPISMPMAISADERFLYAALREPPFPLATFAIGDDGDLELVGAAPLPESMAYLTVHPGGGHLLGASGPGGLVVTMAIDSDGVARRVRRQAKVTGRGHCAVFSPTGPFVYASSRGDDQVVRFHYDRSTGALTDPRGVDLPPGSHPRHLLFAPGGSIVYVITEAHASVGILSVDPASGELELTDVVATRPAGFDALAADIHLTGDGRFLYISERNTGVLSVLAVGAGASLSLVGEVPSEEWTRSFAIDPGDRFLLAPGQHTDHLTVFAIDAGTGGLHPVHRYATAGNPSWVEIVRPRR